MYAPFVNQRTLYSALIILQLIFAPCLVQDHHTVAQNQDSHTSHNHHADHHTSESEDSHEECQDDCCCDEIAILTQNQNEKFAAYSVLIDSRTAYKSDHERIHAYYFALARDGPLFEEATLYASSIVLRV